MKKDALSNAIQYEIDKINVHLPVKVISLRDMIKSGVYGVKLRDGHFLEFNIKEIDHIKDSIPKIFWGRVLLPILITRRRDLGSGAYIIGGSEANLYIIRSQFEKLPKYDLWKITEDKDYIIYRYNLRKIRKNLNTTSVVAFS